jgi:hypothetical protein
MAVEQLQIKIGADVSGALGALKQASNALDEVGSSVNKADLTWKEFVGQRMGAYMKQFGSHGAAIKQIGKEWQDYKATLGTVSPVQNQVAASTEKLAATTEAAFSKLANLDFAPQFQAALNKINASIEAMGNQALGITIQPVIDPLPAINSIKSLEDEMARLKQRIYDATDPREAQRLSVQFGALQREATDLKETFARVSQLKIAAPFGNIIPANLQQGVAAFGGGVRKASTDVAALGKSTINTSSQLKTLQASLGKVANPTNEATLAMVNFGRIIQDAPFGFMGISNNLNPMLESFQRLKETTGTTGGALKAMASSLMGAGGLGIAVSVISSLLIVFGDKLFKSGTSAKEAAKELSVYDKGVKEAIGTISQEAGKVDILVSALKSGTLSRQESVAAIKELQAIAPAYFNTLNTEKLNIDQLIVAYGNYSKSLRTAAEAKGLEKQLDALIERRLDIEKILNPPQFTFDEKGNQIRNVILENAASLKARNQLQAEYNGLLRGEDVLARRIAQLKPPDIIKPGTIETPKVDKPKAQKDTKELKDLLKEKKDILLEFVRDFETIKLPVPSLSMPLEKFDVKGLTTELRDKLNKALIGITPLKIKIPTEVTAIDPKSVPIPLKMPVDIQQTLDNLAAAKKAIEEAANQQLSEIQAAVSAIAVEGFSTIGEAIGAALSGGNIGNVFQSFANFVGSALVQLGKRMIELSPIIAALKAALKTLNPALLLPAGIALVAIGSTLRNLTIKGFAKGGMVPGQGSGDTVPAMLTPGEFVVTKDKAPFVAALLKMMGQGIKLPKVVSRTFHFADGGFVPRGVEKAFPVERMKRLVSDRGRASIVNLQGQLRVVGRDLVYVVDQNQQSQRRNFGR